MIFVDTRSPKPLYEQIKESVRTQVLCGVLRVDEKLPSVRELAAETAINPNTIQKAYSMLERNGIIVSVKGKGSFVSEDREKIRHDRIVSIDKSLKDLVRQAALIGYPSAEFIEKTQQYFTDGKGDSND